MNLPLQGYRILSLAEQYPGPYATMILADLGADVIMVERPAGGDPSRRHEGHFESLNRNKRSLALNLKSQQGREAFLRLVETADVLVEGFRPGVMKRLQLGPDDVRVRRADIVYVSISSFGQTGPMATVAGHDLSIQAVAGLIDIPAGEEGTSVLPWLPLADIASATFAAVSIVAALLERTRSGRGATVDISMLDSVVSWMAPWLVPAMNRLAPAPLPPMDPGYGVFATADGRQISLSIAGEDHLWSELCHALGLDAIAGFSEQERIAARAEILPELRAAIARHPSERLYRLFEERAIAFSPVRRRAEVADDPQVAARGMIVEAANAAGTIVRYVRQAALFDGDGGRVASVAPQLGQDNESILAALGYSAAERRVITGQDGAAASARSGL